MWHLPPTTRQEEEMLRHHQEHMNKRIATGRGKERSQGRLAEGKHLPSLRSAPADSAVVHLKE